MKIFFDALHVLFTLADKEECNSIAYTSVAELRNKYFTAFELLQRRKLILTIRGRHGKTFTEDLHKVTIKNVLDALYIFADMEQIPAYKCLMDMYSTITIAELRSNKWNGQTKA